MHSERRLSDTEVSLVLQRAAEESAQPGLTVAQVQEIARDVGLSPEAVSRALTESASGVLRPARLEHTLGVPVGVSKEVVLPGELTDEAWSVLVSTLRAAFNAHGKETRTGVVREWRNGKLRIAVEPTPQGHRLRMSTQKDRALTAPMIGSLSAFVYAAALAAAATTKPFLMVLAAVPAVIGAGLAAWPFLTLPKWARTRATQFDEVAREAATLTVTPDAPQLSSGE